MSYQLLNPATLSRPDREELPGTKQCRLAVDRVLFRSPEASTSSELDRRGTMNWCTWNKIRTVNLNAFGEELWSRSSLDSGCFTGRRAERGQRSQTTPG